jgi:GMP synthase-like glutamine amidotransferase
MNIDFSRRTNKISVEVKSELNEINKKQIEDKIRTELRGIIVNISGEFKPEGLMSYSFRTSRNVEFASQKLLQIIDENIRILLKYSEYLNYTSETKNNLTDLLSVVFSEYRAQGNTIIDDFLTNIEIELNLYSNIPLTILENIVFFYLLIMFYRYLNDKTDKTNCEEILKILEYITKLFEERKLIKDKTQLLQDEVIHRIFPEATPELKAILIDYSYSIYTRIINVKALFLRLCMEKISEICEIKTEERQSSFFRGVLNRIFSSSGSQPVTPVKGGGKMNILIINLYSKPDKFKKKGKIFKKIFEKKANIIIKEWRDKKGIIKIIKSKKINGIILTGSDFRIKEINKGVIPKEVFKSNIPILGLCYGFQYLVYYYSSINNIKTFSTNKYKTYDKSFKIEKPFKIRKTKYGFHHHDYINKLPKNWKIGIKDKEIIYMGYNDKHIGIQFHPEIYKQSANLFYSMWLKFIRKYTS